MNILELIEELTKRNINMTDREIAAVWDMDPASFSRKKKSGTEIKYKNIEQIEDKLNIKLTSDYQQNIMPVSDRIEINYWNKLPDELKNPRIESVWFDREIIENAWGMSAEHLCIIPMVGDKMTRYWYPIRNGDILIIDTSQDHIMGNGVYFAVSRNNTRFWIREMQVLLNNNIEIKGFAPSGETIKAVSKEQLEDADFKLIGKVIKNVSFRL